MKRIKIRSQKPAGNAEVKDNLKAVSIIDANAEVKTDLLIEAYGLVSYQVKDLRKLDEVSAMDSLNIGVLSALESKKEFNDLSHAKNYLWNWIKGKEIRTQQQQKNLISLNDTEVSSQVDAIHFQMPEVENENNKGNRDLFLFSWILKQKDSKGKFKFSRLEMKVMSKRYLGGMNRKQISVKLNTSRSTISRICKAIDTKIMSLPIKGMASSFGYRPDAKTPKSQVWDNLDGDKARSLIGLCPLPNHPFQVASGKVPEKGTHIYLLDKLSRKYQESKQANEQISRSVRFFNQRIDQMERQRVMVEANHG